jgi:hypothetical protein
LLDSGNGTITGKLVYLTSQEYPDFTVALYEKSTDSIQVVVTKFDQVIASSFMKLLEFMSAEKITVNSKYGSSSNIIDYKFKHKHYEFNSLQNDSLVVYEIKPTLSTRKLKKKKMKRLVVTVLQNTSDKVMFNDRSIFKWFMLNRPKQYQGIPFKMDFFDSITNLPSSSLNLIEIIEISKFITVNNIQTSLKIKPSK